MKTIIIWLLLAGLAAAQSPGYVTLNPLTARNLNLGVVLSDIDSQMPARHQYRDNDRVTWAHETSHGIAARIRNTWPGPRRNGFYCLNNLAILLEEPPTTIYQVAADIPASLRGMSFNLYLTNQARSWNNQPLYILDEWVAYTNGTETRHDLRIAGRTETVLQMAEFSVYAWSMIRVSRAAGHKDDVLDEFVKWMTLRTAELSKGDVGSWQYFLRVRYAPDVEQWRQSIRDLCGREWCVRAFGF